MATVVIKMLKDGSVRICIHWLMRDPQGAIVLPGGVVQTNHGPKTSEGLTGRIACNREQNSVSPQMRNGETFLCCHSDDPRAVTCPDCQAAPEYAKMMQEYGETLNVAAYAAS